MKRRRPEMSQYKKVYLKRVLWIRKETLDEESDIDIDEDNNQTIKLMYVFGYTMRDIKELLQTDGKDINTLLFTRSEIIDLMGGDSTIENKIKEDRRIIRALNSSSILISDLAQFFDRPAFIDSGPHHDPLCGS